MNSAMLHNGKVITSKEYNQDVHGSRLYCIDKHCKALLVFVKGTDTVSPHFKTTGKNNDSKHKSNCGFYKPLSFIDSIKKVEEYQEELLDQGIKETVIRVNFTKLDPDYVPKEVNKEEQPEKKKKATDDIKVKQESATPSTLSSLKSLVKLMTEYEPDVLSSVLVNVKGKKIPLSHMIGDQAKIHQMLWDNEIIDKLGYFVYGTVESVIRREKVYYINFEPLNSVSFSLTIFDRYFKHFTYSDDELIGKHVLAYGYLQKNEYNKKNTTIMTIKSDKYIEFIPMK
ncbi:hypothetical protein [Bacillus sp. AFS040349]|uniref:hypothetical protein n=1 Tax=Bacillus sp. AFS040349 TaxID=2033502 RepID=UPI000BFC8FA7|nr:hypothetical protein [Bacillus sp. AFS040349]PGT83275.1 hypothetical protein COD11_13145 [Bacillus sp. AFS040349]